VSKTRPRGCVSPPAIFVALQPLVVFTGNARAGTPAHTNGTLVCVGCGVADGKVLVLKVVGRTLEVELGRGMILDAGGASCTRFAATSLSKSTF
jgi:hypothetical protein